MTFGSGEMTNGKGAYNKGPIRLSNGMDPSSLLKILNS